ncbi:MAG: thiamine pyrophosphate-dependent enzyme [Thermodesulfobacteriota bacterium]
MTVITGRRYLKNGSLPHMWCSGCGIGIMFGALLRAFETLDYAPADTVIVTGIGCTGKADDYLVTNALHTTHGRALAFATGIKAFRSKLHVVVLMGDGDGVTIGGNHFIHAARRNIDITAIVLNNFNFGMTGGQVSATTPADCRTSTTIYGNPERDFDICRLAEVAGANYVARCTPLQGWEMQSIFQQALEHRGFSVVEVISPCPTHFGRRNNRTSASEWIQWFQDSAIPIGTYKKLKKVERMNRFPVGTLVKRFEPDFQERYAQLKERLRQTSGKGAS